MVTTVPPSPGSTSRSPSRRASAAARGRGRPGPAPSATGRCPRPAWSAPGPRTAAAPRSARRDRPGTRARPRWRPPRRRPAARRRPRRRPRRPRPASRRSCRRSSASRSGEAGSVTRNTGANATASSATSSSPAPAVIRRTSSSGQPGPSPSATASSASRRRPTVERLPAPLDQAVGVEQQPVAGLQHGTCPPAADRLSPGGSAHSSGDRPSSSSSVPPSGRRTSGGGWPAQAYRNVPRGRVEHAVDDRGQPGALDLPGEPLQPVQDQRPATRSDSASAASALRSWPIVVAARRPRPTTSPTASATRPSGSATTSYQSPPTSSDSTAGLVAGGELQPVHLGQRAGQHALLQRQRHVVRPLLQPGPLQRLRALLGQRRDQRPLVGVEGALVGEAEHHRADRPAVRDQRDHAERAVGDADRPQPRVAGQRVRGRGQPDRLPGPGHLGPRRGGAQRDPGRRAARLDRERGGQHAQRLAGLVEHADPGRAAAGDGQPAAHHHRRDLLHGQRLGQPGGDLLQPAEPLAGRLGRGPGLPLGRVRRVQAGAGPRPGR